MSHNSRDGYKRIIQYGDITEIYEYEKPIFRNKRPNFQPFIKKKIKKVSDKKSEKKSFKRIRSITRSRKNFFRTVHHNNVNALTIHFVTLTFAYDLEYKYAIRYVTRFFEKVRKKYKTEIPVSYISVPEKTKSGRFHFHLLIYNLPPETASIERTTRNLQRQFNRGYVDVMLASYTSEGIAGYMAKYMAKALEDEHIETTRGYNCSQNIERYKSYGSNSLHEYYSMIYPQAPHKKFEETSYNVPYLGKCIKKVIKN